MPKIVQIWIYPEARGPGQSVESANVIAGTGLEGDRYAKRSGSYSSKRDAPVTVMSIEGFRRSSFLPAESRRNIFVEGVELPKLIGKEFWIGKALFIGMKYCTVCRAPSDICGKPGFREEFWERGGIILFPARGGVISVGDEIRL